MLWGHIAHLEPEDVSIPGHYLMVTMQISSPGDGVANYHKDLCAEDIGFASTEELMELWNNGRKKMLSMVTAHSYLVLLLYP